MYLLRMHKVWRKMFQSRNRVSSNFNSPGETLFSHGQAQRSFNLVIEYLLISTRDRWRVVDAQRHSFQSRNRVSSNFNSPGETLFSHGQAQRSFNLVIEYLLISTIGQLCQTNTPNKTFQSRNRVSSNFNSTSHIRATQAQYGFNLVIEYLLISTLMRELGIDPAKPCFNLVIEYLLISTTIGTSHTTAGATCFNLVIEYLLIST